MAGFIAIMLSEFVFVGTVFDLPEHLVWNSAIPALVALPAAHFSYMTTGKMPGSSPRFLVLPTLTLFFFIVLTVLIFFRVEYSRHVLGAGFCGVALWYTISTFVMHRLERGRIGLLQNSYSNELLSIPNIDWQIIKSPADSLPKIDALVVDVRSDLSPEWRRFVTECRLRSIPVYDQKRVRETLTGKVNLDSVTPDDETFLVWGRHYIFVRGWLDRLTALCAFPFVALITLFAGIAIKLDDGGPILFVQSRTGRGGRPFNIFKIRTMTHNTDAVSSIDEAMTKNDDERITRVGRFLRRTRLDELPQVFNILLGEMSWIGPRPNAVELSDWYRSEFHQYDLRYVVPPGITGWAQVNQGHVASVEQEQEKVAYDLFYVKNVSPSLDFLIAARTLKVILTGRGAK